jgi:hypothetical protein
MNKTDRAIIVGISHYPDPEFPKLDSPENDANGFFEWLVSPDGGAVPPENIERILSSGIFIGRKRLEKFKPPFPSPVDAKPGVGEVQRAFDRLHAMANENARKGNGHYLGRRLYIYLSGHGFAPSDPSQVQEAALYMANVTRGSPGYSIPGRYNADWFFYAFCFDEILLFMDCCRDLDWENVIFRPYKWEKHPDAPTRVKCLYGFAAKWSKRTRELQIDGAVRSVFTTALLEGLKSAAAGADGKITTNSLYNYLTEHMKEFMVPEDKNDPTLSNEPYLYTYPERGEGFVIVEVTKKPKNVAEHVTQFLFGAKPEAPKFPVVLRAPAELSGKPIQIMDHLLQPLGPPIPAQAEVKLELERGMYLMQVEGSTTPLKVEVSGVGGALDVKF